MPYRIINVDKKLLDKKKKSKFEFNDLGSKKEGAFLDVRVGLKHVFKKKGEERPGLYLESETLVDLRRRGRNIKEDTVNGYNVLKENQIPVSEFKGIIRIRGKEYLKFEKARDLTEKEIKERLPEILKIIEDGTQKGLWFDSRISNFGINKNGKVIIRDTNMVNLAGIKPSSMMPDLAESLKAAKDGRKLTHKIFKEYTKRRYSK